MRRVPYCCCRSKSFRAFDQALDACLERLGVAEEVRLNFSMEEVRLDSVADLERGDWDSLGVKVGLRPAIRKLAAAAMEETEETTSAPDVRENEVPSPGKLSSVACIPLTLLCAGDLHIDGATPCNNTASTPISQTQGAGFCESTIFITLRRYDQTSASNKCSACCKETLLATYESDYLYFCGRS